MYHSYDDFLRNQKARVMTKFSDLEELSQKA